MKDFNLNFLKGKLIEEIAKYHFEEIGFSVIRTGKEELFTKELAKLSPEIKFDNKFQNPANCSVFKIYEDVLSKLPDLLIYKKSDRGFMMKFIEVKYRKEIKFDEEINKNKKIIRILDEKKDKLELKKYFDNLDNLYNTLKLRDWPDVFVYLITDSEIYFGKAYKQHEKNYKIEFLTPEGVKESYSYNWRKDNNKGYKEIADKIKENILINF